MAVSTSRLLAQWLSPSMPGLAEVKRVLVREYDLSRKMTEIKRENDINKSDKSKANAWDEMLKIIDENSKSFYHIMSQNSPYVYSMTQVQNTGV